MFKLPVFFLLLILLLYNEGNSQNLKLKITGLNESESEIIKKTQYKENQPDYNSILKELNTVREKLTKEGYIENKLESILKTNDSLFTATIHLKSQIENVKIYYDKIIIDKKTIDLVSNNHTDHYFIIPFAKIESTLTFLNSNISQEGFPFSKLKLTNLSIGQDNTLEANLKNINNETKRGLDKIIIKGYEKFPKSYLEHFLKIKPEKIFNIKNIKKKLNTLNNLRFANQIKEPEVLFTNDSTSLYIYIEKKQSNTFDGYLGFSTNEETSKLDLNGYLNLELNNNFHYGESFKLLYKSDESDQKNIELKLSLPYLFSTPIGTELEINILKRDSSFTTVNQKAKLYYQLNSRTKLFLGIESIESNNLLENESIMNIDDYNSKFYALQYHYQNRNNINKLPQFKTSLNIEIGLGNRKNNNLKQNQATARLDAFHVFPINTKNSLYLRLNGSTLSSDTYLENELLRLGGINSIRGFQENSITATSFGIINTEYRYNLSNKIYAHTILDYGLIEDKTSNINEKLYSYGIGLGLISKAGLLKLNFANGKTNNQSFQLNNSKIHISLTTLF